MKFQPTSIPDVVLIEPHMFGDDRGFFMETWHAQKFADNGIKAQFVQENYSKSIQGTLRGLHYQIRQPQGKLVRAVLGDIYDVVVDMRKGSSTFGRWTAHRLCAENRRTLWVPPGFAHGFYVVSVFAEVAYKCTDFYAPEHERSLRWDDPTLCINWPLVAGEQPRLSAKDAGAALFKDAEYFE